MNRRVAIILAVAFVIASVCAYLVYRILGNHISENKPQPTTTSVVTAAHDIKLGTVLSAADLSTTELTGPAPKGVLTKPSEVIGRGALSDIYAGEMIEDSRLAVSGSGGGLAATIPNGMRACAVKVDDVVGVSGFATPGMRVDVIITGVPPGQSNQNAEVKTLLQNIEVLSAGSDIQHDATGPKQVQVVNLLVSPEQAELLSLASNQAHIQLVLRNPVDSKVLKVPGTAMSNIYGVASRAHSAPHGYTMVVINGNVSTKQIFSSAEAK